ncbi:MAG: excinuclease ABC subunit UvrC [Candidatus Zipacnadales bacterium]
MTLKEKVDAAPDRPGSYMFRDESGAVLYVGKTISLCKRLRDWLAPGSRGRSAWGDIMIHRAADVEYTVVDSEAEALLLEWNLIREHEPQFNVRLADDKSYPYLKLTTDEPYPRLMLVRELPKAARPTVASVRGPRGFHDPKKRQVHGVSQGRYFGPYTSSRAMRRIMRMASELFGLRPCRRKIDLTKPPPPCLDRHINRCSGPCTGKVTPEEYADIVRQVELFLEGHTEEVRQRLFWEMQKAAESLNYERAARFRDKLIALDQATETQKAITNDAARDQDIVACHVSGDRAAVQRLCIRRGKLINREQHVLTRAMDQPCEEVLGAFLSQYYATATYVPREVLLSHDIPETEVLAAALSELRGGRVTVTRPRRGEKRRLVEMAEENARLGLESLLSTEAEQARLAAEALRDLAAALGLSAPPTRIECFDISNIQGHLATGSMVVMENGEPAKSRYRRFRVRCSQGAPNDYAMLEEVLRRRIAAADAGNWKFLPLPDLLVVDGGKGQLNVARAVLEQTAHSDIPIIALAKEREEVFAPGRSDPLPMAEHRPAQYLLQRLRDEAHRFAITHHRNLSAQRARRSILDAVPGIGPVRKRELLRTFRSIAGLRQASVEEIAAVRGMTRPAAEQLKEYLNAEPVSDDRTRSYGGSPRVST